MKTLLLTTAIIIFSSQLCFATSMPSNPVLSYAEGDYNIAQIEDISYLEHPRGFTLIQTIEYYKQVGGKALPVACEMYHYSTITNSLANMAEANGYLLVDQMRGLLAQDSDLLWQERESFQKDPTICRRNRGQYLSGLRAKPSLTPVTRALKQDINNNSDL